MTFDVSPVNVAFTSCEPAILGTTNDPENVVGVLAEADCAAEIVEGDVVNELPPSIILIVFAPLNCAPILPEKVTVSPTAALAGLRVSIPEIASPAPAIGGGTDNVTEVVWLIIELTVLSKPKIVIG